MDFRLRERSVVRWKCLPSASKMAGKPMAQRNARFREASRLMLAIALLAPSYASEQHECTLDAATCMVSCTACAECTTPSFLYDLGALLRVAVEAKSSATHELLDAYIALLNRLATEATVPLACAYLVTLGSVHEDIDGSEREKLETGIDVLSKSVLKDGLAVLDHTESPRYHELTARQIDLNFLAPQLVEEVRETIARRYARPTTKRKRSEFGKPLIGS